jgi:hypothetical protein
MHGTSLLRARFRGIAEPHGRPGEDRQKVSAMLWHSVAQLNVAAVSLPSNFGTIAATILSVAQAFFLIALFLLGLGVIASLFRRDMPR